MYELIGAGRLGYQASNPLLVSLVLLLAESGPSDPRGQILEDLGIHDLGNILTSSILQGLSSIQTSNNLSIFMQNRKANTQGGRNLSAINLTTGIRYKIRRHWNAAGMQSAGSHGDDWLDNSRHPCENLAHISYFYFGRVS